MFPFSYLLLGFLSQTLFFSMFLLSVNPSPTVVRTIRVEVFLLLIIFNLSSASGNSGRKLRGGGPLLLEEFYANDLRTRAVQYYTLYLESRSTTRETELMLTYYVVHLVGLHIYCKMIHGPYSIKLINAQQAKKAQTYENIKMKLCKCIAAIWHNKTCKLLVLPSPS